MRITDIRIFFREDATPPWIFLKVYTDKGLYGIGEATSFPGGRIIVAALHEYRELLLGRNPLEIENNLISMRRHTSYLGYGGACAAAISGIEIALWDILGKSCNTPIYRLLGGSSARVPLYANGFIKSCDYTPEAYAELAVQEMAKGFTAVKIDPFFDPSSRTAGMDFTANRSTNQTRIEHGLRILEATYTALKPNCRIAVDVHGRFSVPDAIHVGNAMQCYNLLFYEEPTDPDNIAAMRKVSQHLDLPICAGERWFGSHQFIDYLKERVIDIAMPDICRTGGIAESRRISALADVYGVSFAPHNPNGPVGTAASVHTFAACANSLVLEYFDDLHELRKEMQEDHLQIAQGYAVPPSLPGLGVDISDHVLERFAEDRELLKNQSTVFNYSTRNI